MQSIPRPLTQTCRSRAFQPTEEKATRGKRTAEEALREIPADHKASDAATCPSNSAGTQCIGEDSADRCSKRRAIEDDFFEECVEEDVTEKSDGHEAKCQEVFEDCLEESSGTTLPASQVVLTPDGGFHDVSGSECCKRQLPAPKDDECVGTQHFQALEHFVAGGGRTTVAEKSDPPHVSGARRPSWSKRARSSLSEAQLEGHRVTPAKRAYEDEILDEGKMGDLTQQQQLLVAAAMAVAQKRRRLGAQAAPAA